MMRSVLAVLAGLAVMVVMVALVEVIGHAVFPFPLPEGLDPKDPATIAAVLPNMPTGALLFPLLAYAAGSFLGAGTATAISRGHKRGAAIVVGSAMLVLVAANFAMLPVHPTWMVITGVLVPLPFALLGWRVFR